MSNKSANPALHHRIKQLERELDMAIKVRNILIVAGKITSDEFEAAEALVRDLAPSQGKPADDE